MHYSVDHKALWRWLRELNVPDIDLLRSLYHESSYVADLPYGKSAPIPLSRGTKQGDKRPHLLFDLIFNCLLLGLRATGIAHRLMTGLRTPARGFADDLVLCTESPEDMSRLLNIVADFCHWSGMRIKLQKSVASAFDFARKVELPTGGILYKGVPLVHLPADASFCYLGVRASILARTAGGRRPPSGGHRPFRTWMRRKHMFSRSPRILSGWPSSIATSYRKWWQPWTWLRRPVSVTLQRWCRGVTQT